MNELYMAEVLSKDGRRISFQVITNPGSLNTIEEQAFTKARAGAMFFGEGATFRVWKGLRVEAPKGFDCYGLEAPK